MQATELANVIAQLRRLGSDDCDVEAKRAESGLPRSVRHTLSAFANTNGGVVILGLDEASGFAATGVRDPAQLAAELACMAADDMEPPLRPVIKTHEFDGVSLVVAEVAALGRHARPCYYRGAGLNRGSFVRVGDGDRRLSAYEVQILLSGRGQPRDDEEQLEIGADELDADLVAAFLTRLRERRPHAFGGLSPEAALEQAQVVRNGFVTLAGLLALGRYPQRRFPQLMISFVHFPTLDGTELDSGERFLDNVVCEGPIPIMVRDLLAALRRNMSRRATIRGAGRTDSWEYPETAVREAVVNAVVHRDYSELARGAQVQVELYPDRLTVRNAGGLFGPVASEDLGQQIMSVSRNATLHKILEDVPLPGTDRAVCENRGTGIRVMSAALCAAGMAAPQFTDRISTFCVTFAARPLPSPGGPSAEPQQRAQRGDRRAEVLHALGDGELSRAELQGAVGLRDKALLRWLAIMRKEGTVVLLGAPGSRHARYRRADPHVGGPGRS